MGMDESLVPDQAKMILPRRMPDQRDIADAHRIIGADKIRDRKHTLDPLQTPAAQRIIRRSEEHTSELQSLMRISYAVFCLKKKKTTNYNHNQHQNHNYTQNE